MKELLENIAQSLVDNPDGVIVDGLHDCLIKFSKCCAPLPGDEIIGFITRGHGVSIHKRDCVNVPEDISSSDEPGRWINAHWAGSSQNKLFTSSLQIMGVDRDGLLAEVTVTLYNMHVSLHSVNARSLKGGNCLIDVTVSTEGLTHLKNIINHLEKLSGVFSVERINK